MVRGLRPKPCVIIPTCTSCSGFCTGSIRSITVSIRLKIAVLAPMPSASVSTATAVKPGDLRNMRTPYRRSCDRVSITLHPHWSRLRSRSKSVLPNSRWAAFRASPGGMPSCRSRCPCAFIATCWSISSSRSRWNCPRRTKKISRLHISPTVMMSVSPFCHLPAFDFLSLACRRDSSYAVSMTRWIAATTFSNSESSAAFCLLPEPENHQPGDQHNQSVAVNQSGANDRNAHSDINRVTKISVSTGSDQFVADAHGGGRAPVAPEMETRPKRQSDARAHEQGPWQNEPQRIRQKRQCKPSAGDSAVEKNDGGEQNQAQWQAQGAPCGFLAPLGRERGGEPHHKK